MRKLEKKEHLEPAVAEHARHLRVLLAVLLKDELALVELVIVLASSAILAALTLVLRHVRL